MPPKPRLHSKSGKTKSFPRAVVPPPQLPSTSSGETNAVDNERKFEVELVWCIQQLEITLENKNINSRQAEESIKVLKVLKNNTQPVVRKRQLMRQHFGDYRSKMAAEEKKAKKVGNKMSIDTPSSSKSTFIRKSATLTMGDNSFRFNFAPSHQESSTNCNTQVINSDQSNVNQNVGNGTAESDTGDSKTINSVKKLNFGTGAFSFNFDVNGKT